MSPTNNSEVLRVCGGMTGDVMGGLALADESVESTSDSRLPGLFDAHHERLYRLARRLVPSADDARDLVQETFLRVVRTSATIPTGHASEEAWLVRILVNLCRDQWRRRASRRRLMSEYPATAMHVVASGEKALIARRSVWQALDALSPRRRAAIVFYELEGIGIPEIATLLGISSVTVRWHLSQGRRELARIITRQERGTS